MQLQSYDARTSGPQKGKCALVRGPGPPGALAALAGGVRAPRPAASALALDGAPDASPRGRRSSAPSPRWREPQPHGGAHRGRCPSSALPSGSEAQSWWGWGLRASYRPAPRVPAARAFGYRTDSGARLGAALGRGDLWLLYPAPADEHHTRRAHGLGIGGGALLKIAVEHRHARHDLVRRYPP